MKKDDTLAEVSVAELYELVWEKPMHTLSREFGVSDVGLAKICKRHNIPRPERGYWARLYAGRKVKKPPLPKSAKRNDIIRILRTDPSELSPGTPILSRKIIVPDTLVEPHLFVEMAQKHMSFSKTAPGYSRSPEKTKCLDIEVSKEMFERSLRIMDAIIKASEQEGMFIKIDAHGKTRISFDGEEVGISLNEISTIVRTEIKQKERWSLHFGPTFETKFIPSGKLILELDGEYGLRSRWRDTDKRPLERALGDFIENVQKHAIVKRKRRLEREERDRQYREAELRRQETRRREDALERQLENFTYAETLRRYTQKLREGIVSATGQKPQGKAAEWIAWIESRAERYDTVKAFVEAHTAIQKDSEGEG